LSMESIESIKKIEEQAEEIRREALQKARYLLRKAEEEGAQAADRIAKETEKMNREIMLKAEKEAKDEINRLKQTNDQECDWIRRTAEANLDKAVAFIMGRIVKSHGHS
jgi:V/A-type H+-transporting ATPase subunit G/H